MLKVEQVLPSVWVFKQKKDINNKLVYKHKARLNVHNRKQEYSLSYFQELSPILNWFTIRMVLVISIISG